MTENTNKNRYDEYVSLMQEIADVSNAAALLQWDEETYMPAAGAGARARQLATLKEIAHKKFSSKETGKLLSELEGSNNLSFIEKKNVEVSMWEYQRETKIPSELVHKISKTSSEAFHEWIRARKENDFSIFKPFLEKLVELKIHEADYKGYQHHPYNAMLEDYEKSANVNKTDDLFEALKAPLKSLISEAQLKPWPDDAFLKQHFPKQQQWEWSLQLIEALGFDFNAGRQDISAHPFSIAFSPEDVRITTRIDEHDFLNMTWSCMHEAGHAMYEQGLPKKYYGLPSGNYASLSVHESQSRFWENCVGRSFSFWKYFYPQLQQNFSQFNGVDVLSFCKAINKVQPSLIRTEADELTYHFHVMIRYEIEKRLFDKSLSVKDVPEYWNALYKDYLGINVTSDADGCLQDVHWSHGSFGYFPTYSFGSLYAAQYWKAAQTAIPQLKLNFEKGLTKQLLTWLRENIHQHGRLYTSEELCVRITGEPLNINYFIEYYRKKLEALF